MTAVRLGAIEGPPSSGFFAIEMERLQTVPRAPPSLPQELQGFGFPLPEETGPYLCTQGVGGHLTHFFPESYHAIDLRCANHTPVLSIGEGVVKEIAESHKCGGIHAANLAKWNSISILLSSGLIVDYLHTMPGTARVKVGDPVHRGQVLCYSGDIGFAPEPHLHVEIHSAADPDGPSLPWSFGEGVVPVAGFWYSGRGEVPAPSEKMSRARPGTVLSKSRRRLQRLERQRRSERSSQSTDAGSASSKASASAVCFTINITHFCWPIMPVVTVHFVANDQRWSHDFEVEENVKLKELKAAMLNPPGSEEDIDSFELRLLGRRVPDFERISEDCDLDFEFLGLQEGQVKARRDRSDEGQWKELQKPLQEPPARDKTHRPKVPPRQAQPEALKVGGQAAKAGYPTAQPAKRPPHAMGKGPMTPPKRWEVIGGADKGGILVREGQSTTSKQLADRLSTGSMVEELDLRG
eukprot:symbB.v1.2.001378.t1/scaffold67.1/size356791/4